MKTEYMSMITGEVVDTKEEIVKTIIEEIRYYHILNWRWVKTKEEKK